MQKCSVLDCEAFVHSRPPFPPATFVELILPHLEQIKQSAQFRIDVAKIRQAAANGHSKEEPTKMVNAAWKPIPELKTWVGTFGQPEATMQETILKKLARELAIEARPPAWLVYREADRLLQRFKTCNRIAPRPGDSNRTTQGFGASSIGRPKRESIESKN